jgi:NitT/TauT family transport system ATP-binding protein
MSENHMLTVANLRHTFGTGTSAHTALADISFHVNKGELLCIVGPSGCGKSTLLRAVAGLLTPNHGEITLHGQTVHGTVPNDLAVVFQDYSRSLYPWLTAAGNIELPLRHRPLSKPERRDRVREALSSVGLGHAGERYPWQLSGGMQQRVAIARALACRPALLLMDEPFASVDAQTRFELEDLLLNVRTTHDSTVLLVTHDIDESVYLGDRVLVLTPSPATALADLTVDLPAPRHQIVTRSSDEFVATRAKVASLLQAGRPAQPQNETTVHDAEDLNHGSTPVSST